MDGTPRSGSFIGCFPHWTRRSRASATAAYSRCRNLSEEFRRAGTGAVAVEEARGVRALRGRALIEGLGFATEDLPGPAVLLLAGDRKTAVAVLLDRPEEIDSASPRFDGVSPVSYALAQADRRIWTGW